MAQVSNLGHYSHDLFAKSFRMGFFILKCVFIFELLGLCCYRDYSLVMVGVLSVVTSVGRGEALGAQASGVALVGL